MADGPNDLRDPKVTSTSSSDSGGILRWLLIALLVIGLLILLGWLLGLIGQDDDVVVDETVVIEEPVTPADPDAVVVPVE